MPRGRRSPARRPLWRRLRVALLVTCALLGAGAAALWWTLPDVRPLIDHPPKTTAFIELRRAEAAAAGRPFAPRQTFRPLSAISPYLRAAVVASEDARFFAHQGIDWDAVRAAGEHNWKHRRLARGGSTITQQLAKNLYLSPSRDPLRKLREGLIARRLERTLGKERILELYLNVAEWGDGVFGAEAAARHYYGRPAAALSPAQAARLAVALPSPLTRSPAARSPALDRRAARLVRDLRWLGVIDTAQMNAALVELGAARR
jgi:monofunctional glycosyltransferase